MQKQFQQIAEAAGAATTGTLAGTSWLLEWVAPANDVLQLVATVLAIIVGVLTIYSYFRNRRK